MSDKIEVLLVEDNPDDAALVRELLADQEARNVPFDDKEYSITTAEYLKDALEILESRQIDIILLDMNLPDASDMTGIARLAERGIEPPIVMLTGLADNRKALEAIRRGAQEFICKDSLKPEMLSRSIIHSIERQKLLMTLKNLALMDELTNLMNRRGFIQLGESRLKLAEREKRKCMLAFSDLNRLKTINDTYGHAEGDEALVAAANVLKHSFRASDVVARIGGDEFAAISYLADMNDPIEILAKINARKKELCDHWNASSGKEWELSIATGIIVFEPWMDKRGFDELLQSADHAMYIEKERSRMGRA